jgi:hypothetical protein
MPPNRLDPMTNYNAPAFRRTALLPGIIGAVALLAGIFVNTEAGFTVIRYIVSIFALIVLVIAIQARSWLWILPLGAIAVVWNPVWPIRLQDDLWFGLQYAAALVFLLAAFFVKDRSVR